MNQLSSQAAAALAQSPRMLDYLPLEPSETNLSGALSKTLSIEHFFRLILEELDTHLPLVSGCVALAEEGARVSLKTLYRPTGEMNTLLPLAAYHKINERIIRSGRPDSLVLPDSSRSGGTHECTLMGVPIRSRSRTIGSLCVQRRVGDNGPTDITAMLGVIAAAMAHTIQFNRLTQRGESMAADWDVQQRTATAEAFRPRGLIGNSKEIAAVYDLIGRVTRGGTAATVLIIGESGVGKELVANAIHQNGSRAEKPFIKVNCAALPETLLESELFGHEKGAFTGAIAQKKGRFELADGGTIFLDEISEFSLSTQIKLLRVLQEREFERAGGTATIKVDVQVIAATNRNLETMIAQDRFRQDLYYRLNVFPVHVPALRERKTDILLLADYFVEKYGKRLNKPILRISTLAIDMLMAYHWPGNVRELENCIERAALLCNDKVIHSHHLPPSLQTADASDTHSVGPLKKTLGSIERDMILDALKSANGNMAKAARDLGLSERIMQLRVRKFKIEAKRFKN